MFKRKKRKTHSDHSVHTSPITTPSSDPNEDTDEGAILRRKNAKATSQGLELAKPALRTGVNRLLGSRMVDQDVGRSEDTESSLKNGGNRPFEGHSEDQGKPNDLYFIDVARDTPKPRIESRKKKDALKVLYDVPGDVTTVLSSSSLIGKDQELYRVIDEQEEDSQVTHAWELELLKRSGVISGAEKEQQLEKAVTVLSRGIDVSQELGKLERLLAEKGELFERAERKSKETEISIKDYEGQLKTTLDKCMELTKLSDEYHSFHEFILGLCSCINAKWEKIDQVEGALLKEPARREEILKGLDLVFEDIGSPYAELQDWIVRIAQFRDTHKSEYDRVYGDLSLPKLASIYVRKEIYHWNPSNKAPPLKWLETLKTYKFENCVGPILKADLITFLEKLFQGDGLSSEERSDILATLKQEPLCENECIQKLIK